MEEEEQIREDHCAYDERCNHSKECVRQCEELHVGERHDMPALKALRVFSKGVYWSILMAFAFMLEGYDSAMTGSFFPSQAFRRAFGEELRDEGRQRTGDTTWELSAKWQGAYSNGAHVGEIFGLLACGVVLERFGYRHTMCAALVLVCGLLFIEMFATKIEIMMLAEILLGAPWAIFMVLASTYASEVLPTELRAQITAWTLLAAIFGSLVGFGVFDAVTNAYSHDPLNAWIYRIPLALQWAFPVPVIFGSFFAPESPWWLVRRGRTDDARDALCRLRSSRWQLGGECGEGQEQGHQQQRQQQQQQQQRRRQCHVPSVEDSLQDIIDTDAHERWMKEGTGYLDIFRGVDLRRTEICIFCITSMIFCGNNMVHWSTYLLETTTLTDSDSYRIGLARQGAGGLGIMLSWYLLTRYGRRTVMLGGLVIILLLLLVLGALGVAHSALSDNPYNGDGHTGTISNLPEYWPWLYAGLFICHKFVFDAALGPAAYALLAEIASTRLRAKTVIVARLVLVIAAVIANIVSPYMLNPRAWAWGARAGFFWAATTAITLAWAYFRLPESRGRSFADLDVLFENQVKARDFGRTDIRLLSNRGVLGRHWGVQIGGGDNSGSKHDEKCNEAKSGLQEDSGQHLETRACDTTVDEAGAGKGCCGCLLSGSGSGRGRRREKGAQTVGTAQHTGRAEEDKEDGDGEGEQQGITRSSAASVRRRVRESLRNLTAVNTALGRTPRTSMANSSREAPSSSPNEMTEDDGGRRSAAGGLSFYEMTAITSTMLNSRPGQGMSEQPGQRDGRGQG